MAWMLWQVPGAGGLKKIRQTVKTILTELRMANEKLDQINAAVDAQGAKLDALQAVVDAKQAAIEEALNGLKAIIEAQTVPDVALQEVVDKLAANSAKLDAVTTDVDSTPTA